MTRRYGRAPRGPRGQRVAGATPEGRWRTLTVLGALTVEGMLASITIESPMGGEVFMAYLQQVLGPLLQPDTWWSWTTWRRTRCNRSAPVDRDACAQLL